VLNLAKIVFPQLKSVPARLVVVLRLMNVMLLKNGQYQERQFVVPPTNFVAVSVAMIVMLVIVVLSVIYLLVAQKLFGLKTANVQPQ
jgi:hypothetical protein